jgi:hypothetical protein
MCCSLAGIRQHNDSEQSVSRLAILVSQEALSWKVSFRVDQKPMAPDWNVLSKVAMSSNLWRKKVAEVVVEDRKAQVFALPFQGKQSETEMEVAEERTVLRPLHPHPSC